MFEYLVGILLIALVALGAYSAGLTDTYAKHQLRCEAKYSYMPHSKVTEYCKELLKFETTGESK